MSSFLFINDIALQWGGYDRYGGGMGPGMMNWGYGGVGQWVSLISYSGLR